MKSARCIIHLKQIEGSPSLPLINPKIEQPGLRGHAEHAAAKNAVLSRRKVALERTGIDLEVPMRRATVRRSPARSSPERLMDGRGLVFEVRPGDLDLPPAACKHLAAGQIEREVAGMAADEAHQSLP
jgi:hypothetical protein